MQAFKNNETVFAVATFSFPLVCGYVDWHGKSTYKNLIYNYALEGGKAVNVIFGVLGTGS